MDNEALLGENNLDSRLSRRNFLKMGVGALGVIAALEVGGAGLLYVQSRGAAGKYGGLVDAGKVDSFTPGSVTEFSEAGFFLIRAHDGGFLAVHRRCPHLGCNVEWKPGYEGFFCPCHGAEFDFYGTFDGPPVPRSLDTFEVRIKDSRIEVDTSKIKMRDHFSPDQLVYAHDSSPDAGSSG